MVYSEDASDFARMLDGAVRILIGVIRARAASVRILVDVPRAFASFSRILVDVARMLAGFARIPVDAARTLACFARILSSSFFHALAVVARILYVEDPAVIARILF